MRTKNVSLLTDAFLRTKFEKWNFPFEIFPHYKGWSTSYGSAEVLQRSKGVQEIDRGNSRSVALAVNSCITFPMHPEGRLGLKKFRVFRDVGSLLLLLLGLVNQSDTCLSRPLLMFVHRTKTNQLLQRGQPSRRKWLSSDVTASSSCLRPPTVGRGFCLNCF